MVVKSERQLAKELGISRIALWRCKQLADNPEDLFEEYLGECSREHKKISTAEIINHWRAQQGRQKLSGGGQRCPNCGHRFGGSRARQSKEYAVEDPACERAVSQTIYLMRNQLDRPFADIGPVTVARLD